MAQPPDAPGRHPGASGVSAQRRRLRVRAAVAALAGAAMLLTGCGNVDAANEPDIGEKALVGVWKGPGGEHLTFTARHQVILRHFTVVGFPDGCSHVDGRGTWKLDSTSVSNPSDRSLPAGNIVELTLPARYTCEDLTTWQDGSHVDLCSYVDPDSPCDSDRNGNFVLFTKVRR